MLTSSAVIALESLRALMLVSLFAPIAVDLPFRFIKVLSSITRPLNLSIVALILMNKVEPAVSVVFINWLLRIVAL